MIQQYLSVTSVVYNVAQANYSISAMIVITR